MHTQNNYSQVNNNNTVPSAIGGILKPTETRFTECLCYVWLQNGHAPHWQSCFYIKINDGGLT
jgi:hypothetical protein